MPYMPKSKIQASQFTKRAKVWLEKTDQFRVLHDFEKVVNLINDQGEILAIHTADIGMGPFSLQVDVKSFAEMLQVGQGIPDGRVEGGGFKLAPKRKGGSAPFDPYNMETAELWDARPDWNLFSADMLAVPLTDISYELPADIDLEMQNLHQAILENNRSKIQQVSQKMVGRGAGLTPTGDDVLMGTIFALHVLNWDQTVIELIRKQAIGRTTSLSAAFLQAAVAGEATEPWHQLLAGKPHALENILSVGATSGKDAWVGFEKMLQDAGCRRQRLEISRKW